MIRMGVVMVSVVGIAVAGCGSPRADGNARATQIAAQIFATQTAGAPIPTHTPTNSPTLTAVPTATATLTATSTPTLLPPTATSTPVPSPSPTSLSAADWPLVLSDPFDDNGNDWPTGTHDNEFVKNLWRIADGVYRWRAEAHRDVHWYTWPAVRQVSDLYLTVEARQASGSRGIYGLVFRVANDNFYYFGLARSMEFIFLRKYLGDWTRLIDWTPSDVIRPGEMNRITVVGEGSHFDFFINDQLVAEAEDDALTRGRVGVTMELFETGDEAVFEFDNFELRAP